MLPEEGSFQVIFVLASYPPASASLFNTSACESKHLHCSIFSGNPQLYLSCCDSLPFIPIKTNQEFDFSLADNLDMTSGFLVDGDKDEFDPENWTSSSSDGLPKRSPGTNLNVLVIGAGPSGLMTALECWRKGHNVVGILERSQGPVYAGTLVDRILHELIE